LSGDAGDLGDLLGEAAQVLAAALDGERQNAGAEDDGALAADLLAVVQDRSMRVPTHEDLAGGLDVHLVGHGQFSSAWW
jgi:hypothetical protein